MAHKESLASPGVKLVRSKSTKGSPSSLDSSDSKALKIRSVTKAAQSASKQNVRASDLQHQLSKLQEELDKEKEEKARAMQELTDMKRSESKVEVLEKEVQKAKESERKMLESLVSQTKLLEQIKISLEEAKLENKALRESNKSSEKGKSFGSRSLRHFEKHLFGSDVLRSGTEEAEVRTLRNELRSSTEAEEKSKVAMDGLASALKEVSAEANRVKEKLKVTESELKRAETSSRIMEEKFGAASEESERLKCELDESIAAWNLKENGLINCIKMFEDEINESKAKNDKLFESQRTAREENANLRDILKQAINEASVVKESLEIARKENSQLKDQLSDKENKLQGLKQEYECLKVSEAAATDSVTGLKSLLAATSTMDSMTVAPPSNVPVGRTDSNVIERGTKFSSERWSGHNKRFQNGRRHSIGGSPEQKHQLTASLSNMSEIRPASSIISDYNRSLYPNDFDHIIASYMDGSDHSATAKKKKTFLRRFGDMLKRKNSNRQNSSFVVLQ